MRQQVILMMQSVNPATGELLKEYPTLTFEQAAEDIKKVRQVWPSWKKTKLADRLVIIKKVGELLKHKSREYGRLMALEMGKPLKQGIAEAEKCALVCEYYCANAKRFLKDQKVKTEAAKSYVSFEPIGIIFAIMPWNFPFWQVIRCAIPALVAGNGCVLKHASNVPQCALALEELFREAGLPEHCFKTLLIDGPTATKLVAADLVDGVSLTGSNAAGSKVGEAAGKNIKKLVLELGGSDPFIVLDDADVAAAAKTGAFARMINTGQSCIAAKRFIVVKSVADEFTRLFVEEFRQLKMGDPLDETVNVGPLAREDLAYEIDSLVKDALAQGASVLIGGKRADRKGAYYEPTVITNVKPTMRISGEETFGPVATLIVVENEKQAIAEANRTVFGLGASLWTKNISKAKKLARQIEAGLVFVNDFVKSDPRLPFGGVKKSGVGRELSEYGLKEFVNIKSVMVK